VEINNIIIKDIEEKQLIWYGYVQQIDDHSISQVLIWILTEKKERGISKKSWSKEIKKAVNARYLKETQCEKQKRKLGINVETRS